MATVKLECPEGGELILDGNFADLSDEDKLTWQNELRHRRESMCFAVVNRGEVWYNLLTEEQTAELQLWYEAWLNAPETGIIPPTPGWIN